MARQARAAGRLPPLPLPQGRLAHASIVSTRPLPSPWGAASDVPPTLPPSLHLKPDLRRPEGDGHPSSRTAAPHHGGHGRADRGAGPVAQGEEEVDRRTGCRGGQRATHGLVPLCNRGIFRRPTRTGNSMDWPNRKHVVELGRCPMCAHCWDRNLSGLHIERAHLPTAPSWAPARRSPATSAPAAGSLAAVAALAAPAAAPPVIAAARPRALAGLQTPSSVSP